MDEQLWLALKGHALQGRIPSWIIKAIETQDGRDQLNPRVEIKTVTKSYLEFLALQVKLNVSELRVREANRAEQSDQRLLLKTQDQTLIRKAIDGAGLSPWEARVLPKVVEEVYFATPGSRPWQDGQIRYQCVAATAGAGRPCPSSFASTSSWLNGKCG